MAAVGSAVGSAVLTTRQGATFQRQRYRDLVAACESGVQDRLDTIKVRDVQATADRQVANDPAQPPTTRAARALQAQIEEASVRDQVQRVDPGHGGRLDCARAFVRP